MLSVSTMEQDGHAAARSEVALVAYVEDTRPHRAASISSCSSGGSFVRLFQTVRRRRPRPRVAAPAAAAASGDSPSSCSPPDTPRSGSSSAPEMTALDGAAPRSALPPECADQDTTAERGAADAARGRRVAREELWPAGAEPQAIGRIHSAVPPDAIVVEALNEHCPPLDIGTELAITSEPPADEYCSMGAVCALLGNIARCCYVLRGNVAVAGTRVGDPVFVVATSRVAVLDVCGVAAQAAGATDASFRDDAELPDGVTPDFSDDDQERAFRHERKEQRKLRRLALAASVPQQRNAAAAETDSSAAHSDFEFDEHGRITARVVAGREGGRRRRRRARSPTDVAPLPPAPPRPAAMLRRYVAPAADS